MESAWWIMSTTMINGAKMSQVDHIHFWNLFLALSNWSGKGMRNIYTLLVRRKKVSHACSFNIVNFAKAIFLIILENIEILWWLFIGYSL